MAVKQLEAGPPLTDAQLDEALSKLPPIPDNVLAVLRHLHDRLTVQEARP
jgi:hypothetical protein